MSKSLIVPIGELSLVIHRADGSVEDYGVVSRDVPTIFKENPPEDDKDLLVHLLSIPMGILGAWAAVKHPWAMPMVGIVTTAGVTYMATDFASGGVSPTISGFKFHDSGTGTTAAATSDTGLQTPTGIARVTGTGTNPSATVYRSAATITYNNTYAVTEWGLFSAAASGTLWDRRVFTAKNVVNLDTVSFTYNLTISAGGT